MMRFRVRLLMPLSALALVLAACSASTPPVLAQVVIPPGFPSDVPVPEGAVTRAYTGSAETGFVLRVMTGMAHDELREFVSDAVAASDSWSLSPAAPGLPVLPGYDADWALFTSGDQVVTGPFGTYEGGIGVAGSEINILLSPTAQPPDDADPPALPPRFQLPRPGTSLRETAYTQGKIAVTYESDAEVFDRLVDAYRGAGWDEAEVTGYGGTSGERVARGDLANWRVTIRDFFEPNGGPIIFEFENLTLSFP